MLRELGPATHLSRDDVDQWSKARASDLYLGDVVDHTNADSMVVDVTYPRWVVAQGRSAHAGLLTFEPFDGTPAV
jgi:hypothetical protein